MTKTLRKICVKEQLSNKEFNVLKASIKKKIKELVILQERYRIETGKDLSIFK